MGACLTPLEYTTVNEYDEGSSSFISTKLPELAKIVSQWEWLEPLECHAIYFSKNLLINRRDLVVIINDEGDKNTTGWFQDDVWHDLTTTQQRWVDTYFLNSSRNSLGATEWRYTDRGDYL